MTMAVDPNDGRLIWKQDTYYTVIRSRIAYRKGELIIFSQYKSHSLDPKTGALNWTGIGPKTVALYFNNGGIGRNSLRGCDF